MFIHDKQKAEGFSIAFCFLLCALRFWLLLETVGHQLGDVGWEASDLRTDGFERGDFLGGGAFTTSTDDRARVTHALAGWRGLTGDKCHNRLGDIGFDEFGGILFGVAADFADQHNRFGRVVGLKQRQYINKVGANNRIAADANDGALAQAQTGQRIHRFIREGAGFRDNSDWAGHSDCARNNPNFGFARREQARTVWPDQARTFHLDIFIGRHHIQRRNAFGDADDQRHARVRRFANRVWGESGWHIDDAGICAGGGNGFFDRVEHGYAPVHSFLPAAPGRNTADQIRAILQHLASVKLTFAARNALYQQLRGFIGIISEIYEPNVGWTLRPNLQRALEELNLVNNLRGEITERLPTETLPFEDQELFREGRVVQVFVNRYERNQNARIRCIAHYGHKCFVCNFDFGLVYGEIADGFIHVHHKTQLADIGMAYEVDLYGLNLEAIIDVTYPVCNFNGYNLFTNNYKQDNL